MATYEELLDLYNQTKPKRSVLSKLGEAFTASAQAMRGELQPYQPVQQDNSARELLKAMVLEKFKRELPPTEGEQSQIEYRRAMAGLAGQKAEAIVNPMEIEQKKQELILQRDELKRQGRLEIEQLKQTQSPQEQALLQSRLDEKNKKVELLDRELQTLVPQKSVAQQKLDLQKQDIEEKKQRTLEGIRSKAQSKLDAITEIEKGMQFFGARSMIPAFPGTKKAVWEANFNKLLAQNVLDLINEMKLASRTGATGFGAMNAQELQLLKDGATALKMTLSQQDAQVILNKMKPALNKIANAMNNNMTGDILTDRKVGQLMIDDNGNKAMVYPDGTFEEVQ